MELPTTEVRADRGLIALAERLGVWERKFPNAEMHYHFLAAQNVLADQLGDLAAAISAYKSDRLGCHSHRDGAGCWEMGLEAREGSGNRPSLS